MEKYGTTKKGMEAKKSTDEIKIKCYGEYKGHLHNISKLS